MNIDLITNSEVKNIEGEPGNLEVALVNHPRYVDPVKCTGCGECALHCPVAAVNEINKGLDDRRAAYIEYAQAVPLAYAIDYDACIIFKKLTQSANQKIRINASETAKQNLWNSQVTRLEKVLCRK